MSNISLQKNINLASKSQINTLQAEIDAIQIEINNLIFLIDLKAIIEAMFA